MYTTVEDVISRWLGFDAPDEDDYNKIEVLISDVEDEIIRLVPSVPERIDNGELPVERVHRVVTAVIMRAWKLEGSPLSSWQESTGPFMQGGSVSGSVIRGIGLTDAELEILKPKMVEGAFMVDLVSRDLKRNKLNNTYDPHLVKRVSPSGYTFYTNIKGPNRILGW